ncbi:sigma-70 family RNA polymerase sigma factor [Brumimicrobium glaciale]|jgi:RNA polymerase sigma-70 factor (ECF subfamily)|uniref:Sigma-70 family RNA polymerase sigma factor n=1 Tax=Brumimicrobium glaciale TaxID=200475 RepID=A0A4Q4KPP0_9FLAO|nr:sigma-70 family RNA polymerase sigma factor [Brumimicrobium glaciale]RYM35078.1 sigma-70 family RNA polymerase sigma factor [Brumimicrobium glaciale]
MEVGNNLSEKGQKDLIIVNRAKIGDQAAFAELMTRYREPVYFMLLKMIKNTDDAEDLTIEAFGKAFNRIEQYVPNYAFSTWLFKIASNNCIDHIRKKRISLTSIDHMYTNENGESVGMQVDGGFLDPEETFIKQQKVKAMRDIVDRLKPRYKELIIKRYFEELSYDEIAEELDLPLGTVKAQLFRAREFLANVMKKTRDTI